MKEKLMLTLWVMLTTIVVNAQTVTQDGHDNSRDVTKGTVRVKMQTTMGDIIIRLYDATPMHRDNFVKLAKEGYYDGTLFHRVIKDFMIQGGDPDSKNAPAGKMLGEGDPGYTLEAEFVPGLYHKRGALAAAREGDDANPERRSSGSQFYIVWGRTFTPRQLEYLSEKLKLDYPETGGLSEMQCKIYSTCGGSPHLDGMYTVFGEVEEGLNVVEKIQNVPTDTADRPLEDIVIKVSVLETDK